MAESTTDNANGDDDQRAVRWSIIIELEYLAFSGRDVIYDALASVLTSKEVEISPVLFSKYCLHTPLKDAIPELLRLSGKTRLSEQKLISDVTQCVKKAFDSDKLVPRAGIQTLVEMAIDKNIPLGAISSLDIETATVLADKIALTDTEVNLLSYSDDEKPLPSVDAWLKLAKSMSTPSNLCLAVATSSPAAKSALAAGMRFVAAPDRFTAYQDFGGADIVADDFCDDDIKRIAPLLEAP